MPGAQFLKNRRWFFKNLRAAGLRHTNLLFCKKANWYKAALEGCIVKFRFTIMTIGIII
jgi:hypothetical protein